MRSQLDKILLGLISLASVGGIIGLAAASKDVPTVLEAVTFTSLGGLAGVAIPQTKDA